MSTRPIELELYESQKNENNPKPLPADAGADADNECDEDQKRNCEAHGKNQVVNDRLAGECEAVKDLK